MRLLSKLLRYLSLGIGFVSMEHEYPTMHRYGISRHTLSIISIQDWISGQVLHCWSVVKTPCSILIWYLIGSLRHNVLCLQISSFRLACVLGIITVAVLNVFWCWAVLDVVPQIDTCTTGEISAKSLVLGDNNTQSSISSCTPTNITLLQ